MFISQSYASVELKYENSKLFTQFNFYYDLLGCFFADFFRSPRRRSKTPDSGEKLKKNVHFQDEEKTDQSAPRESISLNERTTWQDPREIMHPDGKVLPYNSYPLDSDLNLSNNLVPRVSPLSFPGWEDEISWERGCLFNNPGQLFREYSRIPIFRTTEEMKYVFAKIGQSEKSRWNYSVWSREGTLILARIWGQNKGSLGWWGCDIMLTLPNFKSEKTSSLEAKFSWG